MESIISKNSTGINTAKYRLDYVTNSSSSSFICVAKIDFSKEFVNYIKEQFGLFGERMIEELIETGSEIKKNENSLIREQLEGYDDEFIESLEDDEYYLTASFIEWTNDGDREGEDAFFYEHIPAKYKKRNL